MYFFVVLLFRLVIKDVNWRDFCACAKRVIVCQNLLKNSQKFVTEGVKPSNKINFPEVNSRVVKLPGSETPGVFESEGVKLLELSNLRS